MKRRRPTAARTITGPAGARRRCAAAIAACGLVAAAAPACADRIENGVAVFAALDKVTARISKLEIPLNSTIAFGALKVTPRACYSRPPDEPPKTTTFVEVEELQLDGQQKRLFSGWMFAESPGLNAVEHPVFDVWLTECSGPIRTQAQGKGGPVAGKAGVQPPAAADGGQPIPGRRRPPR